MLRLSDGDMNKIFDARDELRKASLIKIENFLKNDVIKWSAVWYAQALLKYAGFHLYKFDTDEEEASDKIWDTIINGSYNPMKIQGNSFFDFNGSPYFEPYLSDKENKIFPLGLEYSSSVPYDENFKFFFSKLNDISSDLCGSSIKLYALVLYGSQILSHIVGDELANLNAMYSAMGGYLKAKQNKRLME